MNGQDFAKLAAFMAVYEHGGFRGAARRLETSASALSRMVKHLEQDVGARLLNRTTRSVAPTQAGRELYARVSRSVGDIASAIRDAGLYQRQPRGVVRINLPRIAAWQVILPRLRAFRHAYPDVRLDLVIDDHMTDIVREGFDAGMRSGTLIQQDMIAVRVTTDLALAVVGAPAYFEDRAPPRTPADLAGHACLTYRWMETGLVQPWRFRQSDGPIEVKLDGSASVNDTNLILAAALDGAGLAQLPASLVEPALERGALIGVLDGWSETIPGFHLYYPARTHMPAAFRAFVDFVRLTDDARVPPGPGIDGSGLSAAPSCPAAGQRRRGGAGPAALDRT